MPGNKCPPVPPPAKITVRREEAFMIEDFDGARLRPRTRRAICSSLDRDRRWWETRPHELRGSKRLAYDASSCCGRFCNAIGVMTVFCRCKSGPCSVDSTGETHWW